ncbi:MAG: cobalt transporter CbiM [Planctomycetes bacterium]|nr:cobalt transporter CbiM [Planctomycetota bacterium]
MHIAEGVLSAPVLIGGVVVTLAGLAQGLRVLDARSVPRVGLMSAALFVAALVHVPVGVASAHLVLNGLAGLLLGWTLFPALFVALLLQAVLFQFGGLTTLGVNTAVVAVPGVVCHLLFRRWVRSGRAARTGTAFVAGALGAALAGVLVAGALYLSGQAFTKAAAAVLAVHLPVIIADGVVCVICMRFLAKVRPEMLFQVCRQTEQPDVD